MARILFDGGSQRTFVTAGLARRLACPTADREKLSVGFFSGHDKPKTFCTVEIALRGIKEGPPFKIDALVTEQICDRPIPVPTKNALKELRESGCTLAAMALRTGNAVSDEINIRVGTEHYWDFITGQTKTFRVGLKAVETVFRWTLYGPTESTTAALFSQTVVLKSHAATAERFLERFWDLDTIGIRSEVCEQPQNEATLAQFNNSIWKIDGRYEARLPWGAIDRAER